MLSYPITGVREGTLQAERDGLYWNVSAVCSKDWDFPIRLIAETDGARTVLGVPQPELLHVLLGDAVGPDDDCCRQRCPERRAREPGVKKSSAARRPCAVVSGNPLLLEPFR